MSSDPEHSELERDSGKLRPYVEMLQEAMGDGARVVGILEIGSYAKGEAVPSSDIDSRVFVWYRDFLKIRLDILRCFAA